MNKQSFTINFSCFIYLLVSFALAAILSACNEESVSKTETQQAHTVQMFFASEPPSYGDDGSNAKATRAATSDWPDGSRLYLIITDFSGATGSAVYDANTEEWTLTVSRTLKEDVEGRCEVWYFDNAASADATSATLSPTTAIFHTDSATYYYHNDIVHLRAVLQPTEARLRFQGTPGTVLSIWDWPHYSDFILTTSFWSPFTNAPADEEIKLTVGDDGYTPYIYTHNHATNTVVVSSGETHYNYNPNNTNTIPFNINVEIAGASFYRRVPDALVRPGCSNVTEVPHETLVEEGNWSHSPIERTFTLSGNGKTVTFKMIKVEPDTFQMGSAGDNDRVTPVHSVTLTKEYYICETEVTQALWYAVMGQSPISGASQWSSSYGLSDDRPAYFINYEDCQSFLSALNNKLSSQLESEERFRFPTEAEWEFAAKGGNMSEGYIYSGSNTLSDVAILKASSSALASSYSAPVKNMAPNEIGLYDMSGNVYEWCYDWYSQYINDALIDPQGPMSGTDRVRRGGYYKGKESECCVAERGYYSPSNRSAYNGLRLCLGEEIAPISVYPSSLSLASDASSRMLSISANGDITYDSSASWLTITPSSDNIANLIVSATANTSTSDRSATITLSVGSFSKTVIVTQGHPLENRTFTVSGNGKTVTFTMKPVEGGIFMMGQEGPFDISTTDYSSSKLTSVKNYYMGETEVTQALWYAVMGKSPTLDGGRWDSTNGLDDNKPAYYIGFNDCVSFISALNSKLATQLNSGEYFRLPSESEWEFAAKGGNRSNGYLYSGGNSIEDVACYAANSFALGASDANYGTHIVKTKAANELGLYDMSGNVWEWCSNKLRGGSWSDGESSCRVS
ncbi:MAG: SUMF1/EgtB/PvdO family nonheme iron enzyme [Bacteroidaceae bacterium]|nr:SUMF1/EgtB/PvdO family nonheme iron enzyme [Bacteroidaceae bacterium]